MDKRLDSMLNSEYIRVKELGNDVVSLNFTRDAFQDGIWNDETIKARGLFINKVTGDIVARSYNKFFQYDETPETCEVKEFSEPENIHQNLELPKFMETK